MAKDREQLRRELKQQLFVELSELQNKREALLKEKTGQLEKLDDEIGMIKLKIEVIEKLQ